MWRDFTMSSRREANSGGGSYQTKSTSEFHKNHVPQLISGPQPNLRSSYSLPHPAHLQSNTRWQHLHHHDQNVMMMQQQQQQRSTLMHSPSYPHIPSAGGDQHLLHGHSNGDNHRGRPRPVSMYDTPPSSGGGGGGGFSFIPNLLMPNRSKSSAAVVPGPPIGYNASAPASLQHQYHGKHYQQQQPPKKGQIMRQGPGELVRNGEEKEEVVLERQMMVMMMDWGQWSERNWEEVGKWSLIDAISWLLRPDCWLSVVWDADIWWKWYCFTRQTGKVKARERDERERLIVMEWE